MTDRDIRGRGKGKYKKIKNRKVPRLDDIINELFKIHRAKIHPQCNITVPENCDS